MRGFLNSLTACPSWCWGRWRGESRRCSGPWRWSPGGGCSRCRSTRPLRATWSRDACQISSCPPPVGCDAITLFSTKCVVLFLPRTLRTEGGRGCQGVDPQLRGWRWWCRWARRAWRRSWRRWWPGCCRRSRWGRSGPGAPASPRPTMTTLLTDWSQNFSGGGPWMELNLHKLKVSRFKGL